jgi:acetyl-CoA acetyltransferase
VSIAFGFLGPALSVGAGLAAGLEALLVAHDLLVSGDAEVMVVVLAEDAGDAVEDLWTAAGWPVPAHGAAAAILRRSKSGALDRPLLAAAHAEAARNFGAIGPERPGWPTFLAFLNRS